MAAKAMVSGGVPPYIDRFRGHGPLLQGVPKPRSPVWALCRVRRVAPVQPRPSFTAASVRRPPYAARYFAITAGSGSRPSPGPCGISTLPFTGRPAVP